MIFVGDVAVAPGDNFRFNGFGGAFRDVPLSLNLEGAVAQETDEVPAWGCCNANNWTDHFSQFRLGPVFLANNHIHDIPDGIPRTVEWLHLHGLECFGAGASGAAAAQAVKIEHGSVAYLVMGFGWAVIGCQPVTATHAGVNRLEGSDVLRQAVTAIHRGRNQRLVVVIHGNYEFERYPQPAHRKLSKQLIDLGVYSVIFHHPHIVGPVECYKGRTIAYSLGSSICAKTAFGRSCRIGV